MDKVFRGLGSFSVRFRYVIIAAWLIAAVAVPHFLPSLASVTQGNNANFLPASAPSEHAATLAKPFGESNVVPVLVLAARPRHPAHHRRPDLAGRPADGPAPGAHRHGGP